MLSQTKKLVRKVGIAIAGTALMIAGVILLVLPGPGLLLIALGLFVLSLEFNWADKYFKRLRAKVDEQKGRLQKYLNKKDR